ncbi:MAG TPA: putative metal-binding motif-containing protein [Myxococcales bacterium]|nr:putative metal-binding motif-containing protein [Myxococcales bacterium]
MLASRRRSALAFAAGLALGCTPQAPVVRVAVALQGFSRGCVRVLAGRPGDPAPAVTEVVLDPGRVQPEVTVAVFADPAWGDSVEVIAEAREARCDGVLADTDRQVEAVRPGSATEAHLALSATDADGDGFFALPRGTDCDDSDPTSPGATCQAGCAQGVSGCLPDGTPACLVTAHADADRDGHGTAAGPTATTGACFPAGSGWSYDTADCDDLDPLSYTGAPEICDGRDNDCNGTADDPPACPPDAGWYAKTDGNAAHDLAAVAPVGTGTAWVAGATDTLLLMQPDAPGLVDDSGQCSGFSWTVAWYDAWADQVFVGGLGGKCGVHPRSGTSCQRGTLDTTTQNVRGLIGFRGPGSIEPTGVDVIGVQEDGSTFVWDGNVPGDDHSLGDLQAKLRGLHGIRESALFAVGGDTSLASPRMYRFDGRAWQDVMVQSIPGVLQAPLNAVWIVNDTLGYAVGEQRSMLQWDGAAWAPMAGPPGGSGSLKGVVAFGRTSVFVIDDQLHRFDGAQWTVISTGLGTPLSAIGGSSPGDLWAVGADGWIAHWPKPPY